MEIRYIILKQKKKIKATASDYFFERLTCIYGKTIMALTMHILYFFIMRQLPFFSGDLDLAKQCFIVTTLYC